MQGAARELGTLPQPGETVAAGGQRVPVGAGALTVDAGLVADRQLDRVLVPPEADPGHGAASGVLGGVGQRLLGGPVQAQPRLGRHRPRLPLDLEARAEAVGRLRLLDERRDQLRTRDRIPAQRADRPARVRQPAPREPVRPLDLGHDPAVRAAALGEHLRRLQRHHLARQRVREDVVDLAGQPGPLGQDNGGLLGGSRLLQLGEQLPGAGVGHPGAASGSRDHEHEGESEVAGRDRRTGVPGRGHDADVDGHDHRRGQHGPGGGAEAHAQPRHGEVGEDEAGGLRCGCVQDSARRTHPRQQQRLQQSSGRGGEQLDQPQAETSDQGNVLWDCVSLIDDETIEQVNAIGGVKAIAISHPHYYSSAVEWAHAFGVSLYLHEADRQWAMRPDPAIEFWQGNTLALQPGITLIRTGGHFEGGTVCHWAAGTDGLGTLCTGDVIQVVADRRWVSFMYSYPNLVPLAADKIRRIVAAVEPYAFERLYGAWWDAVVVADAKASVRRSAERYIKAIREKSA